MTDLRERIHNEYQGISLDVSAQQIISVYTKKRRKKIAVITSAAACLIVIMTVFVRVNPKAIESFMNSTGTMLSYLFAGNLDSVQITEPTTVTKETAKETLTCTDPSDSIDEQVSSKNKQSGYGGSASSDYSSEVTEICLVNETQATKSIVETPIESFTEKPEAETEKETVTIQPKPSKPVTPAKTVEPDNPPKKHMNLNDVVGSDVETKTLRFYMPDDWMNTYNHFYDGKDLSSCKPAITWYDGSLDCLNYYKDMEIDSYPGYYITDKDETDSNIFVLNIPKDVLSVMFNNTVEYTSDDMRENNDLFKAVRRSVTIPCYYMSRKLYEEFNKEYLLWQTDTFGFYPNGINSIENMIFVTKNDTIDDFNEVQGAWFYYYGEGKYGAYKTLAEAEANDAVYSGGQFPEKKGNEQSAEPATEFTMPTEPDIHFETTAPEETTEPETKEGDPTRKVEPYTAPETNEKGEFLGTTYPLDTTEAAEPTTAEPTTEKVEPTTAEVTTEPQETDKTIKYEDKKVVQPVVKVKANTIKVTAKAKTVKAKKLAKKARKINAITVKNAVGKVTYKLTSVPKKIKKLVKINSKGVITFAKGKYAKKTYKIKVQVTAAGNTEYTSAKKTVTVKVKVK